MTTRQKNAAMIVIGLTAHAAGLLLKSQHISDSPIVIIFLSLLQYAGIVSYISGIHYFGTTYQYEKYPEESRQTLIDENDERTAAIHNLAKAKTFDIMVYILIILPFLLIDLKADLAGIIGAAAALVIMGGSYAYFLAKYKKQM